jgi:hypothetical protein
MFLCSKTIHGDPMGHLGHPFFSMSLVYSSLSYFSVYDTESDPCHPFSLDLLDSSYISYLYRHHIYVPYRVS